MRTGLLPTATTDEWFAMGWTTKQITRVARRLLMARARWNDGITVVRSAVERHIYHAGQRMSGSVLAIGEPQWLASPLYTQCLGFAERPRAKVPIPPKAGWVGAAQVGPFGTEDIGRQEGLTADSSAGMVKGRAAGKAPAPSFESLLHADEMEMGCLTCGLSPSWSSDGESLTAGGWCLACKLGMCTDHTAHRHCENCGVAGNCWEWAMVADQDFVCAKCASWYIEWGLHACRRLLLSASSVSLGCWWQRPAKC